MNLPHELEAAWTRPSGTPVPSSLATQEVLDSIAGLLVVVSANGTIVMHNDRWIEQGQINGVTDVRLIGVGANYLAATKQAVESGDEDAKRVLRGLKAVLEGKAASFWMEYRWGKSSERWFDLRVERLRRPGGGAVIHHLDVSARKTAELRALKSHAELAHLARVATIGTLTASLFHELRQPLTAICANSLAARRLLEMEPPEPAQAAPILTDIAAEVRRANDVMQSLWRMLRRGPVNAVPISPHELLEDVRRLLSNDLLIRNVDLDCEADPDLPRVRVDRVQLTQVLICLAVNGIEAMETLRADALRLVLGVRNDPPDGVLFEVRDFGPGIPTGSGDDVFDPFVTTKSNGTGLGLTIARSIVENHGGEIWAENGSQAGARFLVRLPVDSTRSEER
ncbi:MAG: hypothetical protein GEU90_11245 [Gemmatimonas sp.]|nr:hypothetical protein [Gemmatimonas sp.]